MKKLSFLLLALGMYACQGGGETSKQVFTGDMATEEVTEEGEGIIVPSVPVQGPSLQTKSLKIIKTARLVFEVEELANSIQLIQTSIQKYDAYTSTVNQRRDYGRLTGEIDIRVASKDFENLIQDLEKAALYVDVKSIEAKDVTEEYVDIQTRLKTQKKIENRYLEILQEAQSVEEILKVEEKIGQIREEIEAKEGRLKFLNDQIRYSTIHLEIYQTVEEVYARKPGFFSQLSKGISTGWENLLLFIVGLTYFWPFLWLLLGLGWLVRRYRRKRSKKTT